MNLDGDSIPRRVPTLVQLCQRVAGVHVDQISSLGDELTFDLVKPILERCNAEQLLRLEELSPHLQAGTPNIWEKLCFAVYPLTITRHSRESEDEPRPWKDHYYFLRDAEAKRLEEAGTKLRNQRLEAEERKKEREVKITDRVPLPKRQRAGGWPTNPQPKTLFQKTKTEASKLQKNMYNARIIPPMPSNGRIFRVLARPPDVTLPFSPSSGDPSRVTVNKVVHRRPVMASTSASTSASSSSATSPPTLHAHLKLKPATLGSPTKPPAPSGASSASSELHPLKPPIPTKRDPMASLFVPKRRPNSQRP